MSFETGTASSREDLLDKFRAFALTSGYTINRFAASGTGYVLNIQKTGYYGDVLYINLRSVNAEGLPGRVQNMIGIVGSMSDAYDAAKDCVNQPGAPATISSPTDYWAVSISPVAVVAKYWFFSSANPEQLAMVIQLPSGEFRHLIFGLVKKTDATVGKGAFMYSTNGQTSATVPVYQLPFHTVADQFARLGDTSILRLAMDERDGWWTSKTKDRAQTAPLVGTVYGAGYNDDLLRYYSLNKFSNSAALVPFNLYALKQDTHLSMIGYMPHLRSVRREAFIVGHDYPLGTDVWMAFPTSTLDSTYSLVYRKEV